MKYLIAVGITSNDERLEFEINSNGELYCYCGDLVSLEIPIGVEVVFCWNNKLVNLLLPESVEYLYCEYNLIRELKIPNSVKELHCDRNVKGLDKIDWDCKITLK